MTDHDTEPIARGDAGADPAARLLDYVGGVVLGQQEVAEVLLASFMADGHALLEGVPGVGKTLLARAFAAGLGLEFSRIQFTPDLMPSDVTGVNVFDQQSGRFQLARGPIFTQILMADEINRTPPKTQSALLEAMQERQVSIDGESYPLGEAFFVMATQNPVEFEGTYPLPEAQLDRFLVRIEIGLPESDAELEIFRQAAAGTLGGWSAGAELPPAVVTPEEAVALRHLSRTVHVEEELLVYLKALADAVRTSPHVELGVSPRGVLSLLEVARAGAVLEERDYLSPDDCKRFLAPCWGHRILLVPESELEGATAASVLASVADSVPVPR